MASRDIDARDRAARKQNIGCECAQDSQAPDEAASVPRTNPQVKTRTVRLMCLPIQQRPPGWSQDPVDVRSLEFVVRRNKPDISRVKPTRVTVTVRVPLEDSPDYTFECFIPPGFDKFKHIERAILRKFVWDAEIHHGDGESTGLANH